MAEVLAAVFAGIFLAFCRMHWPQSIWHREDESGLGFAEGECREH